MPRSPLTFLLKKTFADIIREEKYNKTKPGDNSRRQFLKDAALTAGGVALLPSFTKTFSFDLADDTKIAIVGAGMAGLNSAYQLKKLGLKSTVYEASARTGGRMLTLENQFGKNITTDLGGEFVDTTHTEIIQLTKELNVDFYDLRRDSLSPKAFYFDGKHLDEQDLRDALLPFSAQIEKDMHSLPEKINHTTAASFRHLDNQSISEYISGIGIKGWLYNFLTVVLTREYGMEASEQSAINFLIMFSDPSQSGKDYELFGDDHEVFKIKGGSQHLTNQLYKQVREQVQLKYKLTAISNDKTKGYELTFDKDGTTQKIIADYVILALPFSILRKIKCDIDMPAEKRKCIEELGYGNSGKFIMGMRDKPWRSAGMQGYTFTDLAFGCGWDSSQSQSLKEGSFTVFGGGNIIENICNETGEDLSKKFIPALDTIYTGAQQAYTGKNSKFCWSKNPFSEASYSSFKKGQWSTLAGWEAVPLGDIYFAGEHVSLDFQGYMNGAAQTGRIAADMIAEKIKAKA
ncbi:MAG: FAD-dependent oxidoreductase [Bacteroidetes bacterium]|nr:FAD-dependent oxidoreductase [Bacteroidota bacterium]